MPRRTAPHSTATALALGLAGSLASLAHDSLGLRASAPHLPACALGRGRTASATERTAHPVG